MAGKIAYKEALEELHPLPSSTANDIIQDVVGSKTDTSFSGYNMHPSVIGHLKSLYYHAHGKSFTLPENAPVEIAPAAVAWEYGTPVSVGVYATAVFDVHWVQISGMGDNGNYNIQLCNADGSVVYGKTAAFRDTNFVQAGNVPIQVPPLAKGTEVFARVASSTGNATHTIAVKLFCHPYNDLTD